MIRTSTQAVPCSRPPAPAGDPFLRVYDDLRRLARSRMRFEAADHTLSATGLVHEVWLRLLATDPERARDPERSRNWFLGMATRVIRQVLVDHARRRGRKKRGGEFGRVPLDEDLGSDIPESRSADAFRIEVLKVHEALRVLERIDPFQAEVAELRLFGGLTLEQAALVTEQPVRLVRRRWQLARAWLAGRIDREHGAFRDRIPVRRPGDGA